jgi:excinuclease ABC subunit A
VGLGYIRLGQPATTLSGGEAQRVKLASELSRRSTGRTMYILDEPTTGLSFEDASKLLHVLHRLVDAGNTVVIIEHHLDVIKNADWLIDLGPLAGERGGELVAEGTPEFIASVSDSHTGRYLREVPGIRPDGKAPGTTVPKAAPPVTPSVHRLERSVLPARPEELVNGATPGSRNGSGSRSRGRYRRRAGSRR